MYCAGAGFWKGCKSGGVTQVHSKLPMDKSLEITRNFNRTAHWWLTSWIPHGCIVINYNRRYAVCVSVTPVRKRGAIGGLESGWTNSEPLEFIRRTESLNFKGKDKTDKFISCSWKLLSENSETSVATLCVAEVSRKINVIQSCMN